MDPNACARRILDAVDVDDWEEAEEGLIDLQYWLARGGARPTEDLMRMVNERLGETL